MHQSLIIVDDLFNDPQDVRDPALGRGYPEPEPPPTFPGRNSSRTFLPDGLDRVMSTLAVEALIGCPRPEVGHGRKPERWDRIVTVPMRFDRLVFYRPWMRHSAADAFGRTKADARPVHLVSFERAPGAAQGPAGALPA